MAHDNLYKNFTPASLFKESQKHLHAHCFFTPHGGKSDAYNAACLCNRCGACAQYCPSYKALSAELYSPRGRNQLARLVLERKLSLSSDAQDIKRTVTSCIMCGQCSAVCPVNAPSAALMAELKTALKTFPGRSAFTGFLAKYPHLHFAFKNLKYRIALQENPKAVYLPSVCGLKFAKQALNIINQNLGAAAVIKSGLLLGKAALTEPANITENILKNIKAEYDRLCAGQALPLVVDNIEDYRLLKQAFRYGIEEFIPADKIIFISELLKKGQKIKAQDVKAKTVLVQSNNLFFNDDAIPARFAEFLDCSKAEFLVKFNPQGPYGTGLLAYRSDICGTQEMKRQLAFEIAAQQADIFIVFSAADKKFFESLLKSFYPYTNVMHITEAVELFYDR